MERFDSVKRIIAVVIALALLVFGVVASVFNAMWASDWEETFNQYASTEFPPSSIVEQGDPENKIAVVNIEGTIMDTGNTGAFNSGGYNHEMVIESLKQIASDDTVNGVMLNVDSPGGGVYESAEIHSHLQDIKDAGKTIYSSMGGMAASGGYYVSAPADQIFATNETITGSIGVIMQSINYSQLAEEYGIEFDTYTSGDMKDMLSGSSEPTQEEEEYVQGMVDSMFQDFVDVVEAGRGMSEDEVRNLADGRVYLGDEAVDNGLADQIGYPEDAMAALQEELGGNAQVVEYGQNSNSNIPFSAQAKEFVGNLFGNNEIAKIESLLNNRQGVQPMYLYEQ
ncbi:signal peptide peptidase SppA [Salinicoccus albus]|uniref:signal peptide peptidase SppA n=1 Tax=Salinicoccus albus TaxID=418756 RepID=UPI000374A2CC|nr:signal peptide peptidase SppA [Salinicoccus albus]